MGEAGGTLYTDYICMIFSLYEASELSVCVYGAIKQFRNAQSEVMSSGELVLDGSVDYFNVYGARGWVGI